MATHTTEDAEIGNDVQIIRNILFGEQVQLINKHIKTMEENISALKQENHQLRQALEAETKSRQQIVEELTQRMETQFRQTKDENDQEAASIRERHNQDMTRLVSMLASALSAYQNNNA